MDYKHLSIGNIPVFGTGGYMLSVDKALSYDRDAIGIGRKGTIDKPYILKAPFWTVDTLFYCIPRDEGTLNFDYDLFQCIDWKQKDESTGVPSLSKVAINDTDVIVPKTEEQKKIGYFFEELDLVITLHQSKCYGRLRHAFLNTTISWEQRKLGELAEIKDSARIPNAEWSDFGVPYIRASDITNKDASGVLFISNERYEFYKNKTGAPIKGDVLFNGGGEIGKTMLNSSDSPIYVQGGAVLYARTSISDNLEGQYLKTYFETPNAQHYFETASAGGTMKHFTLKPSQEMPIKLPQMKEQKKIGSFFSELDTLITLHQKQWFILKKLQFSPGSNSPVAA